MTLPLQACMFLGVIGNLIYAVACIHKDNGSHSTNISLWMVCVGRIVAGLSAGGVLGTGVQSPQWGPGAQPQWLSGVQG